MDTVYSLNTKPTHPLSGMPMSPKEHRRVTTGLLMIVLVIALIFAGWYWYSVATAPKSATLSTGEDMGQLRAQMTALLKSSPVHASQTEVDSMTAMLEKSQTTIPQAERDAMTAQLRGSTN